MTEDTDADALVRTTPRELGERLRKYGFISPTGAPFDDDLESRYQFHMRGGPLTNVVEWIELRRKVGAPSEKWG
jgi:hypothetical protein